MNPPFDKSAADVVLIVDDQPGNLAVLHDALDESGYTVLVATSGEQALARVAQALPDIVLLDAVMPGMDGFEVARRLKASAPTAAIPIVFMTGLTDTEHVVAAFAAGGVEHPFTGSCRRRKGVAMPMLVPDGAGDFGRKALAGKRKGRSQRSLRP